ncbi:alpha/beta fold hydrolase [Phaeospirillum tilakii]|uniref:Alpha/beta fold hydrolase n=1 Tax=Phaeospirillum tilakii TaxID=741673 RepID=A0ABW5C8L6_9PROT
MIARVERDGVSIAYRVDGRGPGLVLVHGTGADGETNWAALTPDLARDWTVVRPDYAGSGQTRDGGGPLTVAGLAAQVVAAAEAAGAVPFDLVGFSLGAAVAATIAADRPDLVRRLVLLGPLLSASDPRLQLEFRLWRDLIGRDRATLARLIVLTGFSPAFVSQLGAAGLDDLLGLIRDGNDWEGMARQVELDLVLDVTAAAARIVCPTLVVGQRLDHMVPAEQARAVAAAIPGARHAELDTGHLGLLERPGEVAALLRGFLRGEG